MTLFEYPFMVHALEAGAAVAVLGAVAGWFMVLRRQTFAGHTLSLMAFPGAAGALLIGVPPAAGYFTACGVAGLALRARAAATASALTGSVQALGLALGFIFLSLYHGVVGGYESLLFGNFLGVTQAQVGVLAAVAAVVIALAAVAGRPLLFASVDPVAAGAAGVPVQLLGSGFLVVLGLAVAAAAQITGSLLVLSLLVAPPAAAQLLTARAGASLALGVALGLAVAWGGLAVAFYADLPAGFTISAGGALVYGAAWAWSTLLPAGRGRA